MKPAAIICDLDGTLCDISHRKHHFLAGEIKEFEAKIRDDRPIDAVRSVLRHFHFRVNIKILFVTARDESLRGVTANWLKRYLFEFGEPSIFMRESGDIRADFEVKRDIYHRDIKDHHDILLVLEDRDQCVRMWRQLGIPCWQVADGDY